MVSINIRQFKRITDTGKDGATIEYEGIRQRLSFSRVVVGYGKKVFFRCPICNKNKESLFWENNLFRCSDCCSIKQYSGIQNTTKGGDAYISYKMERFAMRCGVGQFDYPFDFQQHPRPKGKRSKNWNKNLAILQCLENMRFQSIVFGKIWNQKTIQSIEKGKNKFLLYPLKDLKNNFYSFDNGY